MGVTTNPTVLTAALANDEGYEDQLRKVTAVAIGTHEVLSRNQEAT